MYVQLARTLAVVLLLSIGRPSEAPAAEPFPGTLLHWNTRVPPSGGPPDFSEPLASDRPDFTETSCTVGQGVTQIEMGYTYFDDRGPASRLQSHSFPEMLCRIGAFADWLELRAGWNYGTGYETFNAFTRSTSGVEDLYLGVKLGLTPQQGSAPEMALVPQMSVPLGSDRSAGAVLPGLNWLYGWDVTDCLSTAGSTQINMAVDDASDDMFLEFAQSWTIGFELAEPIGLYTEWFVIVPAGADSQRTEHYLDAGVTWRVSNNLQLDVRAGKGVSGAAVDFFTGAGLVVRF